MSNLLSFIDFFNKGKTFRPKKKFQEGSLKYALYKHAQASLNSGINLRAVVQLPADENFDDWLAVHGGPRFEYLWTDGKNYKRPTALPAPQYISLLMDWIEEKINDEKLFPTKTEFDLLSVRELEPLQEMTARICADKLPSHGS